MIGTDQIYGYVDIKNCSYPFFFCSDDFVLHIYPPTKQKWLEDKYDLFENSFTSKAHKWVERLFLDGVTSDEKRIRFCVVDNPSSYNGFKEYEVRCAIICSMEDNLEYINGIRVIGGEMDIFYPSERALETTIQFEKQNTIKRMSVSTELSEYYPCGKYRVSKGIDAIMEVKAFATIHHNKAEKPIEAESLLKVTYTKPVNIDVVLRNIDDITRFMYYAFYRKNIVLPQIELYWTHGEKNNYSGQILMPFSATHESHKKAKERVIGYDFWGKNAGKLLTLIKNNKLKFDHLCQDIEGRQHYLSGRFIMILTAFEREFRNIYGIDAIRSDKYKEIKNEVVEHLEILASTKTGNAKKYVRNIAKGVKNTDDSYSVRVKKALLNCQDVMEPFVRKKYHRNYMDSADGIAERAGYLRNGFAHSRLDFQLEPIHLADIRIIEELTYAMRLKTINKDAKEVQKAINALFGENIAL